jgi:alpha-ketoglutarate-dependent taurine dioxygenase
MDRLKTVFQDHPLLIFKGVDIITPTDFLHFVKQFDPNHDSEALNNPDIYPHQMLQPFDQFPDCNHVAPRGNVKLDNLYNIKHISIKPHGPFINKYVWHTDILGHEYKLPNVITGFHIIEQPLIGGDTDFISGETVYEHLTPEERIASCNILVEINRRKFISGHTITDYSGVSRTENYEPRQDGNTEIPIIFSEGLGGTPCILLMPPFFERVVGWSISDSRRWIRDFMNKHVLPHRVSIQWKRGDLAVFNNRRFMHSSTPARNYLDNMDSSKRLLLQTFIPTNQPLYGIQPLKKDVNACYNINWMNDQDVAVISAHNCIKYSKLRLGMYNTSVFQDNRYIISKKP